MLQNWLLWVLGGYLCGSVPFGLLIGLSRGTDIRRSGSGNVGATNVGRVLGRPWGVLTFVLDLIKGLAPVLGYGVAMSHVGVWSLPSDDSGRWMGVAAATIVGHIYPVWLRFKGGKGVATGLGAMLGVWPVLTLAAVAATVVWISVLAWFRYVGLASITATVTIPLVVLVIAVVRGHPLGESLPLLAPTAILALLVIVRHRGNIARIRAGTEPRIGRGSDAAAGSPTAAP